MSLENEIAALTKASNELTEAVIDAQHQAKTTLAVAYEKMEVLNAHHQSDIATLKTLLEQAEQRLAQLQTTWHAHHIFVPLTLTVGEGQDFATLQTAWDSLQDKILYAPVTIQLMAGVFTERVLLKNYPYAHQVIIQGTGREQTILQKPLNERWPTLALMNVRGLTLAGMTIKGRTIDLDQTLIDHDEPVLGLYDMSYLLAPTRDLAIEESWRGIGVDRTSYFYAPGVHVRRCRFGIVVDGGRADINGGILEGLGRDEGFGITSCHGAMTFAYQVQLSNYYWGMISESHGTIVADEASVKDCIDGIRSAFGGCIFNSYASVENCTWGYVADHASSMHSFTSRAGNCTTGYQAAYLGQIYAMNSTVEQCETGYEEEAFSIIESQQAKLGTSPFPQVALKPIQEQDRYIKTRIDQIKKIPLKNETSQVPTETVVEEESQHE